MPIRKIGLLGSLALAMVLALIFVASRSAQADPPSGESLRERVVDRSPIDFVIAPDERLIVTANRTSDSVSLIDVESGRVLDEVACAGRPAGIAISPDGARVFVTTTHSANLCRFAIRGEQLIADGSVRLGFAPRGIVISPDGKLAYVALSEGSAAAVVDLVELRLVEKINVGQWPRQMALTSDGKRLAVGVSGEMAVAVVDTESRSVLYHERFTALNLGQMQISPDDRFVYVPWIAYGSNPITAQNIRRGWVIASRVARVKLDGPARREAIALDKQGEAVGDPHGLGLSPNEDWLVVAASGSHELLFFRQAGLPWQDYGGPGDTIDESLVNDAERFFRIPLGGRPTTVRFSRDGERVFVVNYLENAIQVASVSERKLERAISLGPAPEPSLARRGEAIFYDARRSLDQWYSCHSCHFEGGVNAMKMDTANDGGFGTFKTVLDLHNSAETAPWTWHGWQKDFAASVKKSLIDTMLGPEPTDEDAQAMVAYLSSLEAAPNPQRDEKGKLSPAGERGRIVFESEAAGCVQCHRPPYFTDGEIHDVGTGSRNDRYEGFNTPSLLGVHRRARLLHDGRANSLDQVLTGDHAPERVSGGSLTDAERADLIEYLRSL